MSQAQKESNTTELNLTSEPKITTFQPTVFLYLEKTGPFMNTAMPAWQEFMAATKDIIDRKIVETNATRTRIDHSKKGDDAFVLQAGMLLKSKPETVPAGLQVRTLDTGKFASFILTGSYAQLPAAYPAAFERVAKAGLNLRNDFCLERYLNDFCTTDYANTKEEDLKTEILIPIE